MAEGILWNLAQFSNLNTNGTFRDSSQMIYIVTR